jgi:hypothetical protein
MTREAPFQRGETFMNGMTWGLGSSLPSGEQPPGFEYEGREYIWDDSQMTDTGGYGTGLQVVTRVVRNSSDFNILPGQLCTFTETRRGDGATVLLGTNVGGIAEAEATYCYPADEFLPPGGVAPGDLFYIVVEGPCMLKTAKTPSGTETANIAIGQKVVSATASGTTDGNAGAVVAQDIASATSDNGVTVANQIQNAIGRALSATTTNQTGTSILVAVGW